jgi:hypothetical protein
MLPCSELTGGRGSRRGRSIRISLDLASRPRYTWGHAGQTNPFAFRPPGRTPHRYDGDPCAGHGLGRFVRRSAGGGAPASSSLLQPYALAFPPYQQPVLRLLFGHVLGPAGRARRRGRRSAADPAHQTGGTGRDRTAERRSARPPPPLLYRTAFTPGVIGRTVVFPPTHPECACRPVFWYGPSRPCRRC